MLNRRINFSIWSFSVDKYISQFSLIFPVPTLTHLESLTHKTKTSFRELPDLSQWLINCKRNACAWIHVSISHAYLKKQKQTQSNKRLILFKLIKFIVLSVMYITCKTQRIGHSCLWFLVFSPEKKKKMAIIITDGHKSTLSCVFFSYFCPFL